MRKNPDGQVELVLENRQLLIVFFAIVALCGVFFSLGYIVGHNTLSSVEHVTQAAAGAGEAVTKPSPMPPAPSAAPSAGTPAGETSGEQPAAATDLNFYQSVEEKAPESKLGPAEAPTAAAAAAVPAAPRQAVGERTAPAAAVAPAGASPPAAPAETPSGILLQVSALTRREDANALVSLIREKKLPVMVVTGTGDTLFHVLVGPYKNMKDAEHAKTVLEADGFRPIIKK